MRPGDCTSAGSAGDTDTVSLVPCNEPHGQEVYSVIASTDTSYPGGEALAARGEQQCLTGLGDLVTEVPEGVPFSTYYPVKQPGKKTMTAR